MPLPYHILDVFTESPHSGNPLAVVLNADALTTAQMQAVARECNLSETVFVRAPRAQNALAHVRIFTPARELPFAGHPTVGTACLLSELGIAAQGEEERFVLEEGVGPVPVSVRRTAGRTAYAELTTAQLPEYGPAPDEDVVAAILGLQRADLGSQGERVRAVSCGVPFVLVPLLEISSKIEVPGMGPTGLPFAMGAGGRSVIDACSGRAVTKRLRASRPPVWSRQDAGRTRRVPPRSRAARLVWHRRPTRATRPSRRSRRPVW